MFGGATLAFGATVAFRAPLVVGILNISPDSFSERHNEDGSLFKSTIIERANQLIGSFNDCTLKE